MKYLAAFVLLAAAAAQPVQAGEVSAAPGGYTIEDGMTLVLAGQRITVAYVGIFVCLLAIAALVPALVGGLLRLAGPWFARSGPWAAYVLRSARASRHRTGTAMAALMVL